MVPTVAVALLALETLGSADAPSRDELLVEAAAVPDKGTVRLSETGGATPVASDGTPGYTVGASIIWSLGAEVAAGFAATNEGGKLTPAASLRWQLLHQEANFLDATGFVRFKSVGFSPAGPEMEAEAAAGRSFGRFRLVVNGVVGTGLSAQRAVDVELKSAVTWRVSDDVSLGAQAALRQEVGQEADAVAGGRDRDVIAGPTCSVQLGDLTVQALAGWGAPRGTAPAGPVAIAQLAVDL